MEPLDPSVKRKLRELQYTLSEYYIARMDEHIGEANDKFVRNLPVIVQQKGAEDFAEAQIIFDQTLLEIFPELGISVKEPIRTTRRPIRVAPNYVHDQVEKAEKRYTKRIKQSSLDDEVDGSEE